MHLVFFGLFLISTCFAKEYIDYCEINKDHILCGANEPLDNIPTIKRYFPKTNGEREDLLQRINKLRNAAAGGNLRIGQVQLPKASNMFELEWCDICEKAALNHLKRCNVNAYRNCCNCMNTGKMDLFSASLSKTIPDVLDYKFNLSSIFEHFSTYLPKEYVPLSCLSNVSINCLDGLSGLHFGLLNARQVKVGCAYGECYPKGKDSDTSGIITCITNLDFKLDIEGNYQYLSLEPASECPKPQSEPSKSYPNLCKCENTTKCLIQPAELSQQCTTRKGVASITLQATKQVVADQPTNIGHLAIEANSTSFNEGSDKKNA